MWATFLESFNGIPLKVWCNCDWDVQLFSDAAGSTGFGLYWKGRWCAKEWLNEWKNGGHSIAFLELFPLIVAVCLLGAELRHSRVLFRVDNMAVVQMVNRQSAHEAGVLQLMRVFVLQCLRNDIYFRARHVPGVNNDIADALSRSQCQRFHGLATEFKVGEAEEQPSIDHQSDVHDDLWTTSREGEINQMGQEKEDNMVQQTMSPSQAKLHGPVSGVEACKKGEE
ncbi:hypothetical protein NDU88_004824 [Pleurodeles waltl]|uniref:RNase H type-1 domain-containing protein n=1 Tax=Pleurodeles waltl TaxID=8319 RepID=A0AAV7TAU0_PLEWA|nr:hypothetical protein NDU88_004824 [Pleurodeles waltl]